MTLHKIKQGFDVRIAGKADSRLDPAPEPLLVGLMPPEFVGVKAKVSVQEGDDVATGDVVFFDKKHRDIRFLSPATGKVRVFANRDDFLMAPQHIEWLERAFGDRNVSCQPKGGHMGSLFDPTVREKIVDSVEDLLVPHARTGTPAGAKQPSTARPR